MTSKLDDLAHEANAQLLMGRCLNDKSPGDAKRCSGHGAATTRRHLHRDWDPVLRGELKSNGATEFRTWIEHKLRELSNVGAPNFDCSRGILPLRSGQLQILGGNVPSDWPNAEMQRCRSHVT